MVPRGPFLPPALLSRLSFIASLISSSISFLSFLIVIFVYIFLFILALWLLISLYCYTVEVIFWFVYERRSGQNPVSLFEIVIPNPNLRFKLKIAAVETGIWLTELMDKLRRVSDKTQGEIQDLAVLPPPISYKTTVQDEMQLGSIDCAICLDDFVDDELCRAFPVCNHIFHLNCIDQWLLHRLNCPLCRNPLIDV